MTEDVQSVLYPIVKTDCADLADTIRQFEEALPGWWWSLCSCALTRDASCGPDARVLGMDHAHVQAFDAGFHEAWDGSLAGALGCVMNSARDAVGKLPPDATVMP